MQYFKIALRANEPFNHSVGGKFFLIDEIIGANVVDVVLVRNGTDLVVPNRRVLFKAITVFESLILKSPVDCICGFFVSFEDVNNGAQDEQNVSVPGGVRITNTAAEKIPVEVFGAVLTATNVGISNNDAAAVPVRNQALTVFAHRAAVAVGLAAGSLGAADATLRKLIFRNDHASAKIALGGAGVTLAGAPVVLLPGDIWKEEDAAGAEWFAISDTAGANVQIMGIK